MQEESISYIDRDISSYSGLYDIEISLAVIDAMIVCEYVSIRLSLSYYLTTGYSRTKLNTILN